MFIGEFLGNQVNLLGLGCMRLPVIAGNDSNVDIEKVREMVKTAFAGGINYFDTAWGYHGGQSELVMGEVLKDYPRSSFYLASKFPGYDLRNMPKVREIFPKQLEKCQTEYFDYYLIHNVCEMNINEYLDEKFGIMSFLLEQKALGKIRHLGFSCHGSYEVMEKFLAKYGQYMEFCQLQLNYVDFEFQLCNKKMARLEEMNIPVVVMEPLRGGSLANLRPTDAELFYKYFPEQNPVEVAFQYLCSFDNVKVILSGMSNLEQLKENIEYFRLMNPFDVTTRNKAEELGREMTKRISVPCTACRYCLSHCPQEINIPDMLALYNEHVFSGGGFLAPMALMAVPEARQPKSCLSCHSCEEVCPQQIKITDHLAAFANMLK